MRIPTVRGTIDRRLLVNFRVDPQVLARVLPSPFRPQLVNGRGMAGICLIRLKQIRPRFLPPWLGIHSENAAHRMAVEWDHNGHTHQGVFIPRRDTSSRLNALVGGRLFPGVHHHARFQSVEHQGRYRLEMESDDGEVKVAVEASTAATLPATSIFASLEQASEFFERGSLGYSATARPGEFDGLELRTERWRIEPLAVERVESSYFDDTSRFPAGSVAFDSAFLMRGIDHGWHSRPTLYGTACEAGCGTQVPAASAFVVDACRTDL